MTDYKLVPVDPTPEMVEAGKKEADWYEHNAIDCYKAMLAAAPAVQGEPQSAEQQPCPEDIREGAPYDDPAFSALCREHEIWGTAAAALCAEFWEAGKRAAEQKPEPDVEWLVEALTELCDEIDKHDIHAAISKTNISWFKRKAREALSAHRERGGEA